MVGIRMSFACCTHSLVKAVTQQEKSGILQLRLQLHEQLHV